MSMSQSQQEHLWQGEWIDDETLAARVERLAELRSSLPARFPLEGLLAAADRLGGELRRGAGPYAELRALVREGGRQTEADIDGLLATVAAILDRGALELKLRRELGAARPFDLLRVRHDVHCFEAWAPLGLVVHIAPANVFTVGSLGVVEGLLSGNCNFLKTSPRDSLFPQVFLKALGDAEPTGELARFIIAARLSSKRQDLLQRIIAEGDAVSAWGSEESVEKVRALARPGARVIPWGHRISFAFVARGALEDQAALGALAHDCCLLEQQACSSPQTVFVETDDDAGLHAFAARLAAALARVSPTLPALPPEPQQQAELTMVTEVARLEACQGEGEVLEPADRSFRVLVSHRRGLEASPLFRSVWVKRLAREELGSTLSPLRSYLQTAGLACPLPDLGELAAALIAAGVTRVTRVGQMLESYDGAPHDGVYALAQLCKRVSVQWDAGAAGHGSLEALRTPARAAIPPGAPVLTKQGFQARPPAERAELLFRSGGSSGKPVMSTFTYEDYHRQMQACGLGLLAAGLDPLRDRVINLFAAGNLYGGFLSFFTILESLGVAQLPMGLVEDYAMVGEMIVAHRVNTLLGPPSFIIELCRHNLERFRAYGGLEKVYYGGDHLTRAQAELLRGAGARLVRSAAYGSNDAGPLGYQCLSCEGSVHHLLSSMQALEIFRVGEDVPVGPGETGRLLFTSRCRAGQELVRYEIGDLGRWVEEPCPCGRREPRFELLGRTGDVFKAGGPFLSYGRFASMLSDRLGYGGRAQVRLENRGTRTVLALLVERGGLSDLAAARQLLVDGYPELGYCLTHGLNLDFDLVEVDDDGFTVVPETGKLRHIVDRRLG